MTVGYLTIARLWFALAIAAVFGSFACAFLGNVFGTLGTLAIAGILASLAWLNARRYRMGVRETALGVAFARYVSVSRDLGPSERIVLAAGVAFPTIATIGLSVVTFVLASRPIEALSSACAAFAAFSIALTCFVRLRINSKRRPPRSLERMMKHMKATR